MTHRSPAGPEVHVPVWTPAIDLRDRHNIDVEKLSSMHVEVARGAYDVLGRVSPP